MDVRAPEGAACQRTPNFASSARSVLAGGLIDALIVQI